jgi:heparanase
MRRAAPIPRVMGTLLMSKRMSLAIYAALALVEVSPPAAAERVEPMLLSPGVMRPIAKIDERFLSYNVEMAEVIGGNFWKPYTPASIAALKAQASSPGLRSGGAPPAVAGHDPTMFQARPPIGLSNARLRKLAAALAPAYMRTSGTWANSIYFHHSDGPPPPSPPKGFQGVLTRTEWKSVIDFSRSVGAKLVTSFAISAGVRDSLGVWTPDQARKFVTYTKEAGGDIAAAEFFNEPDMPVFGGATTGYNAADYARDFAIFRKFATANAPDMAIVGPGSVGEGVLPPLMSSVATAGFLSTNDMLLANPPPKYDVFSYHFYGAASIRCVSMGVGAQTTPEVALSEAWLARADTSYDFYVRGLRDRFEQGKPVWITETADSACGGNPWASTFLDSFRFLDQLARMARQGVSAVFHNTLASSEYGLLDQNTFTPRPNYWAALLWRKLMGSTVLDAGPLQPGLHLYAHCLLDHAGGVTLLAINLSRTETKIIDLPTAADVYVLTAPELGKDEVRLNGQELRLSSDDELPDLRGKRVRAGRIDLEPASISFLVVSDAGNTGCE